MGILSWIVVGLIAGYLAKLVLPGRERGGILTTLLLGIVGGVVGGYIGSFLGLGTVTGINLWSILLAFGGAVLVLVVYRALKKR
ncbi:MAG: GlsB/YeaQ/YmgE family stress response membrane protein [Anaerolineae bacterium]|jgi:uncharacterized membrane protein YeaQ/YmgE (transglycosylase-associated protein family)|nr:GlsB/YeaQ/YmgE family stress response membrane protein [Anaerolineae bacterium]